MADFWENFAEAMGWGKANHTRHLSDISEEERQKYRNQYTDSAVKAFDKDHPYNSVKDLRIENAKDSKDWATTTGKDFNEEFGNDKMFDTEIYSFGYYTPYDANNMDKANGREYRTGHVLVRVPKRRKEAMYGFGDNWYNGETPAGRIGVYEAVLDDGTVLSAEDFNDLIKANPYDNNSGIRDWKQVNGISHGEELGGSGLSLMQQWKKYIDELGPAELDGRNVTWNKKYRRWMSK